jgi:hypothetical protein
MSDSRVEFEVTEADVLRLFDHYVRTSPTSRRLRLLVLVASSLVAAALIAYTLQPRADAFIQAAVGGGILAIILVWGGPFFNRSVWRRSIREAKRTLLGKRILSIDDDGILSSSSDSESRIRWSAINRIDNDADHIFLMLGGGGIVVPKRAFTSASQSDAFVKRAQELRELAS